MDAVPRELTSLLANPSFAAFHRSRGNWGSPGGAKSQILRFLSSTMDETRTSVARQVSRSVANIMGVADFGTFRDAVLRRELTAKIEYPKQRDHSSHTVYNYLLGWYFLLHSARFRRAVEEHLHARKVPSSRAGLPFRSTTDYFGSVWQYASLFHDVGYMFEGGLSTLELTESSRQAAFGARVARDYFGRRIWLDYSLEQTEVRERFRAELGGDVLPPEFPKDGVLADIADRLRCLGDLACLAAPVRRSRPSLPETRYPTLAGVTDAFDLWQHHYKSFDQSGMASRISSMRRVFNALMDEGLPNSGVCLLDHGVCSGLLLLLAATYYYRLYATALDRQGPGRPLIDAWLQENKWLPTFWWTGIVWATAAAALHNVAQLESLDRLDPKWPGKLALEEDPLTFLGILVDLVEEWDRYSVFKKLDWEPIQGPEVRLGRNRGRVLVSYTGQNGNRRAARVRGELERALVGWDALIEVKP